MKKKNMKIVQIILLVLALGFCGFALYRFIIDKVNPGQDGVVAQNLEIESGPY